MPPQLYRTELAVCRLGVDKVGVCFTSENLYVRLNVIGECISKAHSARTLKGAEGANILKDTTVFSAFSAGILLRTLRLKIRAHTFNQRTN
jgi:hypothetical protein